MTVTRYTGKTLSSMSNGGEIMKVLVACEESQEVCKAFRKMGHEAFSCDIQPCTGGRPEWHIQGDCLQYINGNCQFFTMGGYGTTFKARGICS